MSRKFAGLVFDLDETLVDSRAHILAYNRRLFAYLGKPFPEQDMEAFFTLSREGLENRFFSETELEEVRRFRRDVPYASFLHEIRPKAGADDLIAHLRRTPKPTALLTNRGETTDRLLDRLGWSDVFDPVLNAERTRRPKPDPWGLECIAATWRAAPSHLAFVGDSEVDLACARSAGALAVQVAATPHSQAELHFEDLYGLLDWLRGGTYLDATGKSKA